jgi:DNA primase
MKTITNFEQLRGQVKECLDLYLSSFGVVTNKKFLCPVHSEKSPSASVVPGINLVHCFGCQGTWDIFDLAAIKEGKPLTGRGFLTDNLMYLAKKFGIPIPELDISDEELYEIQSLRAYAQASRIIQSANSSDQVSKKLKEYMWPADVISKIGIGSVNSYSDYIDQMTNRYGHALEFLTEIDLAGKDGKQHLIFQPQNLIYTIRDEDGNPIAFAARNLNYESETEAYKKQVIDIAAKNLPKEEETSLLDALWRPRKYINSRTTKLFEKKKVLFNFSEAKKSSNKQVVVFEGQPDAVTIYAGGIKSAVACCGTAFTLEHLEMCIKNGIKRIVLVFDPDLGGEKGTKKFIETLSQYGDHPGLDIIMVQMPQGTDDPDAYVRSFGSLRAGVKEFLKLPQTDLFSWKIREAIDQGADPVTICNDTVPLIINQPNDLLRLTMADRLAIAADIPKEFVRREVLRRIDEGESKLAEEKHLLAIDVAKSLTKDPTRMATILASAVSRIEVIDSKKIGYDPTLIMQHTQRTLDKMRSAVDTKELVTGYELLDSLMGGIPKEGAMVSVPGKPFHGKALTLDSKIKTNDGWVLMKDIKIGDKVASVDGASSIVTGIYPQGIEETYRVTFSDGRSVDCSGNHLWKVHFVHQYSEGYEDQIKNGWHVFTTDAIRTFCLNSSNKNHSRTVFVPTINGEFGNDNILPVDPWLLGVLLGDGGLTNFTPTITSNDPYIIDKIKSIVKPMDLYVVSDKSSMGYRISNPINNRVNSNKLTQALKSLEVMGKSSADKFIPKEYLESNRSNRLALLQGLVDTDGFVSKDCQVSYTSVSLQLAKDVQYLVWSLGGTSKISDRIPKCKYKGVLVEGLKAYTVSIMLEDRESIASLPRKKERLTPRVHMPRLSIVSIEPIGKQLTQCITVSHASKLFVTNDFVVTHNSIWFDNLIVRILTNNDNAQVMLHHVDDASLMRIPRILGVMSGIPSRKIMKAGASMSELGGEEFEESYIKAETQLLKWVEEERLILADQSLLSNDLTALEGWVKQIRRRHPDKHMVVIGDNFHLFTIPGFEEGENKVREMSRFISSMPTKYGLTTIFSMELPKGVLSPGVRPRYTDSKNSGGISFDSKVNMGIYQEMQDLPESQLTWLDSKYMENMVGPNGEVIIREIPMPIIEVIIDKNKVTGTKKTIYYRLEPNSGIITECSSSEQYEFQERASNNKGNKSYAESNRAF